MYDVIWLWLLSLPLFAMVAKSWYPWCCCDVTDPPPCSNCTADAATVTVTISGAADDYCNQCNEAVNGSFVLVRNPTSSCQWRYSNYVWPCTVTGTPPVYSFGGMGIVLGAQTLSPSINKGWYLTLTLNANFKLDTAVYRWNSGGSSAFDCTATRSLTYFSYVPDPVTPLCSNMDSLTITVN